MARVTPNRVYEDYDPPSDLVTEDGCATILLYLPGIHMHTPLLYMFLSFLTYNLLNMQHNFNE